MQEVEQRMEQLPRTRSFQHIQLEKLFPSCSRQLLPASPRAPTVGALPPASLQVVRALCGK